MKKMNYITVFCICILFTCCIKSAFGAECDKNSTPIECYTAALQKLTKARDELKTSEEKFNKAFMRIDELEKKNIALESQLQAAQNIANAASSTAISAISKADTAQQTANTGVSKADAAQSTANTANGKYCYITGNGFDNEWGICPYGGSHKGGVMIHDDVAGIKEQNRWSKATYFWLCCL